MEYSVNIIMADPAGNRTAFITDPVPARLQAALGAAIVADEELDAEQAGFITMPGPGHPGHLQMSGGEFCGNASRSFGYLIGREQHMRTGEKVTITVSGAGEPLQVTMGEGGAEACMPPWAQPFWRMRSWTRNRQVLSPCPGPDIRDICR